MNADAYIRRIGLSPPLAPDEATLFALQKAHLYSVPYENLDILAGAPISLEAGDLFEKIVVRGRGGCCFELNALYRALLEAIGYSATSYFARFLRNEPEIPMRRHHVLRVRAAGMEDYLCDVGVGTGSPTHPILLREGLIQEQGGDRYRLVKDDFLGWVLEEEKRGEFVRVYSFTEEPQIPVDFAAAMFYCERHEKSIFNKAAMISLRTEGGRATLDGDEFRVFDGGEVSVTTVADPAERRRLIGERFGIRDYD